VSIDPITVVGALAKMASLVNPGGFTSMVEPTGDSSDISLMGRLMGARGDMSAEEMAELRKFGLKLMDALRSGTFDAATLAEAAPEALQEFADDADVDLNEAFSELAQRFEERLEQFRAGAFGDVAAGGDPGSALFRALESMFGLSDEAEAGLGSPAGDIAETLVGGLLDTAA
jgi:hypothetical protein